MMERLHAEVGRIHATWHSLTVADVSHVEMIDVPFRCGPGKQRGTVWRGHDRHARQMHLVPLALMFDLGAWAKRERTRAGALGAGHPRWAGDDQAQHDPCENDWKRHEPLLSLNCSSRARACPAHLNRNSTGRRTHIATGSSPRRAGSNRHCRTAVVAAWSRSG